MLDDDIQYMGTRPAQRAVSDSPFSARQTIYDIVLHIERSATDSPYELIFSRASTDVVHIGRLSSTEVERWHGDSTSALFKCAVVSRSHAKIVFSDSGHVAYLIDMKSHHGTHLRRLGETVSRMLIPDTPAQLTEGDIITFGKSVGSHADLVRPVVARVELRYRRPDNGLKPLITPNSPVIRLDLTKGSPKSSSGRYGLYDSSSSSSDDSSSVMSDHDSDIEEIPVSGANAVPLQPRGLHSAEKGSKLTHAFEVFKRLMPPVHVPPPLLSQEGIQSEASDPHASYLPPLDLSEEYYPDSPIYSPYSPRSISPMFNMPSSQLDMDELPHVLPTEERSVSSKSPYPSDDPYAAYVLHNLKYMVRRESSESDARSKSSSPMDLASSPPFSHHPSPAPEQANEPSIIGAYPKSRSSSPSGPSRPAPATRVGDNAVSGKADDGQADAEGNAAVDVDNAEEEETDTDADADADAETDDAEDGDADAAVEAVAEAEAAAAAAVAEAVAEAEAEHAGANDLPESPVLPQAPEAAAPKENATSNSSAPGVDTMTSDVSKLRIGLTELQGEVEKLQFHRRKYKERFNTNVNKLSDKLSDMDGRIAEVNAQYNVLCDQVADAIDVDIPDLQGQVDALQNQMDVLVPILDMTSEPPMHEREDVKASIQTLHDLVADMRTLRDTTQKEMTAALEAVRAARDTALITIATHAEAPQVKEKTPVLTSSKRKRYDEQDEDDSGGDESRSEPKNNAKDKSHRSVQDVGVGVGADGVADVIMAEGTPATPPTTLVTNHSGIDVPSPKRSRRVAAVVVQTATAVTVGAVATWSALAFS